MARRVQAEPWSADFEREIVTQIFPDLIQPLKGGTNSRDARLGSPRTKQWLMAAGIAAGAPSVVMPMQTVPATPVAQAAAGLTPWLPARPSQAPKGCSTGETA